MPEGDTVFRAARLLDRRLSGRVLASTDFRVPQHATADLAGGTVVATVSRGKHLLTRIDRGSGDAVERWTLHTHLKMEGAWRVLRPRQPWPRPGHQARVVLETSDAVAVGFSLGVVELIDRSAEDDVVGHLGPDLLGPDWDEAVAVSNLVREPGRTLRDALLDQTNLAGADNASTSDRTIAEALLDQRCLAGIGNMWMAETLFLTGVSPFTQVVDVPDLRKIVRMAYRLLQANKERAVQATTGSTRRGEERYVYGRARQPCRRCGTRIEVRESGAPGRERPTYWCPACQPPV